MAGLNKRILCFVDECGTAGENGFALGSAMVWARDCGKADKCFSDLLPPNASELHASNLKTKYLQSLLARYAQNGRPEKMFLMNRLGTASIGTRPEIYASDVIETVKIAVKKFRELNQIRGRSLGNVELILDRNHQNTHPEFLELIHNSTKKDGKFRAVEHIAQIDSAASRLLQLADIIAHARMWLHQDAENAKGLREKYGISVY